MSYRTVQELVVDIIWRRQYWMELASVLPAWFQYLEVLDEIAMRSSHQCYPVYKMTDMLNAAYYNARDICMDCQYHLYTSRDILRYLEDNTIELLGQTAQIPGPEIVWLAVDLMEALRHRAVVPEEDISQPMSQFSHEYIQDGYDMLERIDYALSQVQDLIDGDVPILLPDFMRHLTRIKMAQGDCPICLQSLSSGTLACRHRDEGMRIDEGEASKETDKIDESIVADEQAETVYTDGQDENVRMEGVDEQAKEEVDRITVCLPCHGEHMFHESCIRDWLRTNPTCPMDRIQMPIGDGSAG